jgi:glycosyltransferase involved in cell wall biosynthesis
MRLLIACTHLTLVGGVETYLKDLIRALRERGHEVGLLSSAAPAPGAIPLCQPAPDLPAWSLAGLGRAEVLRAVETWGPDVCFLHGLESPADEAALLDRYPTVLFAHGHNGTCVSGTRTHAFPTYRPCLRRFGPGCLLHYFPRRCGGLNPVTMARLYVLQRRRQRLFPRYPAVIVTSRSMVEEYLRHGVPEERLHRVPLFPTGLTPDAVFTRAGAGSGRVLMVGRLYKDKGAFLLVEALALANRLLGRSLTLVVAGEGPEQPRMKALASRRGVQAEFHGWVAPEARTALMRSADLLAVPSVCPETFGLVGVEAGCVGLPAVGFAVGGIPDWLLPGTTGELAPGDPPTARGLAEAIVRVLEDSAYRLRLGRGAWQTAGAFSLDAHVDRVTEILHHAASPPVAAAR